MGKSYGSELVIPLPNGGTLRCGTGSVREWGGHVRVCAKDGTDVVYYDSFEWEEEPELVLGAVFAAALGIKELPNPRLSIGEIPAQAAAGDEEATTHYVCNLRCKKCRDVTVVDQTTKDHAEMPCSHCGSSAYLTLDVLFEVTPAMFEAVREALGYGSTPFDIWDSVESYGKLPTIEMQARIQLAEEEADADTEASDALVSLKMALALAGLKEQEQQG